MTMGKNGKQSTMRILGVDPGTLVTGFGVIDCTGSRYVIVEHGTIKTGSKLTMPIRLKIIHEGLADVIGRTLPDEFAIESAFYARNVQSTLKLGHARGVSILAAVMRDIPTSEYAPREVKQSVVGNGNAKKEQVAYMIRAILGIRDADETIELDASDALAVALCHATRLGGSGRRNRTWKQVVAERS